MIKFAYTALDPKHATVKGILEAQDRTSAMSILANQNLQIVSLKQTNQKSDGMFKKKVKVEDLVIFTRQLSTMVNAGVSLIRALGTLQAQSNSKRLSEVLAKVNKDVQGGQGLGDSFAKHPDVFSEVYVNMVRAGEAGGILDEILNRLAEQQEKNASVRKKVRGAMAYPLVLLGITVAAFFGLMIFVIPQIGKILTELGGPNAELPEITRAMLVVSDFMINQWYILVAVAIGTFIFLKRYLKTPEGKSKFHYLAVKTPIVGNIIIKLAVSRFARTFSSLLGAGVSVLEALRVTGNAVGNIAYQDELKKAAQAVKNGKQLSDAIRGSKLFPPIVPEMLAVGEETGQTDTVLIKVADFYEEEVDTLINSLSAVIQPIMIILMGSVVGLIAASVMGPIASLANNIQ
jgi:type IV pilus assembly protein PilC